jgi:D-alanyl-D-alanine carboxypeptidase
MAGTIEKLDHPTSDGIARAGEVPAVSSPMMARLDDPRPGRRPVRRVAAASVAAVGVLVVGLGLSTVALSGLRQPATGADAAALASPAASPSGAASPATSPGSSASIAIPPTPEPSAQPGQHPTRAEIRAARVRLHLQAELDSVRARLGIPGVSVTIIFADGSSWIGTSGHADVEQRTDVTPDTAFAIASVSKTYTAALILALVRDGEIDLDAPARRYVPEAAIDKRITVRQLLDHTSGLDDFFLHPPIDRALLAEPDAFWSVRRTLKYVGKPYFPPGRGWHYSNTNYLYLGLIAERVTGVPLAIELRERFFIPHDLDETWYQAVEKPLGPLAHGYRFAGPKLTAPPIDLSGRPLVAPFRSVITAAGGAGSIAATSSDAARWARLLYSGTLLGPEMTRQMLDGVAGTASYRPRVPYGLGVQAFPIDGRLAVGHSGRLLGFRSAVRYLPDDEVTIAVLTNQSRADPAVIVAALLSIVFEPEPPCFVCPRPA